MKENFLIKIETWHKPDMGQQDNVSIVMYDVCVNAAVLCKTWHACCVHLSRFTV